MILCVLSCEKEDITEVSGELEALQESHDLEVVNAKSGERVYRINERSYKNNGTNYLTIDRVTRDGRKVTIEGWGCSNLPLTYEEYKVRVFANGDENILFGNGSGPTAASYERKWAGQNNNSLFLPGEEAIGTYCGGKRNKRFKLVFQLPNNIKNNLKKRDYRMRIICRFNGYWPYYASYSEFSLLYKF